MSDDIYKPNGFRPLVQEPQIRLCLQGAPGAGKTWEALTFPNPCVLNFDRGLGAHVGRTDVIEIPFFEPAFVDSYYPRDNKTDPPNRKNALHKWLGVEALKLKSNQTLVIDSNTQINNAYHADYNLHPVIAKSGKVDDFGVWNQKVDYFGEIMELLKALACHVVYICHETSDRDKTGELNGKVRALIRGQFGDELASHFTDYFRCHTFAKPTAEKMDKFKEFFKLTTEEAKEWIASTPNDTLYVWQTQSDEIAKGVKTSSLVGAPKFILANYNSFAKYKRKTN